MTEKRSTSALYATALVAAALFAAAGSSAAADEAKWLHVIANETGHDGQRVRVNVPLAMVEAVLPLIEEGDLSRGHIRIGHRDWSPETLRALRNALREAPDGEYVTVEGREENVRVSKEGNHLVVKVREESESPEGSRQTVDVRIPMPVVDALLSSETDELDLLAAIRVLGDYPGTEIVAVDDEDARVRVWVDLSPAGEGEAAR